MMISMDITSVWVGLTGEACRALDEILRTPRNSVLKAQAYQKWVTDMVYERLGGAPEKGAHTYDLAHVPPDQLTKAEAAILSMYLRGSTYNEIARTLNETGFPTRREGSLWRHRTVQLVLDRLRREHPRDPSPSAE